MSKCFIISKFTVWGDALLTCWKNYQQNISRHVPLILWSYLKLRWTSISLTEIRVWNAENELPPFLPARLHKMLLGNLRAVCEREEERERKLCTFFTVHVPGSRSTRNWKKNWWVCVCVWRVVIICLSGNCVSCSGSIHSCDLVANLYSQLRLNPTSVMATLHKGGFAHIHTACFHANRGQD